MEVWKIIFLSKWVICRFHVNLPGCKLHINTPKNLGDVFLMQVVVVPEGNFRFFCQHHLRLANNFDAVVFIIWVAKNQGRPRYLG